MKLFHTARQAWGRTVALALTGWSLWALPNVGHAANLVEVAAGNPQFSTLVTAVQAAGLVDTLASPGPFTLFAPNNDAFAKLPPGTVDALLQDTNALRRLLLYHVAPGAFRSTNLVAGPLVTVQGAAATINLTGGVKINNATVIAADVAADNGVIHVIDSVILPPPTVTEIAVGNPDFSTLVTALQVAGLVDLLKTDGPFTVFAPNNAAFAKVPPATLNALLADPAKLRQVLLYHVVPGRVRSTDLTAGKVITAQGSAATINLTGGVKINDAAVIAANVEASNGVIHVIDSVILPPPTVAEIAVGNPDFSTLVTALQVAGLVDLLKTDGPFTVFAPNNAAFAKVPAATLNALLADPAKLRQVLLYHVVPGRVRSTDLTAGKVVTAQGSAATINLTGGVKINDASVIAANVEASNGVIHVIDSVILPPPSVLETALASSDFSTLVTAIQAAGLVDVVASLRDVTVFAPNNAAFAKLPAGTLESLLANTNQLRTILLYHLVSGRVRSGDLTAGKVVTLQGAAVTVNLTGGVRINSSQVVAADVEASNGVLHVLDTVLLPPPDLVEIAAGNPDFSTLVTAVQAAGLVDTLKGAGPFTLFAPNNAAFAKLPAGTLQALLADPARLKHILLYHVTHGPRLRAADLRDGPVTSLQGAPVRIDVSSAGVTANQAGVLAADIEGVNGIIHVIDSVLLPGDGFSGTGLSAVVKGDLATVVWPAVPGSAAVLESAPAMSGPWTPVTVPTVTADGITKVELPAAATRLFFRLKE